MFHIPVWLSNVVLLITCYIAGFQHVVLRRRNPVTNPQFFIIVFALAMMLINTFWNRESPWPSIAFFVIALVSLGITIRRLRTLPPSKTFDQL